MYSGRNKDNIVELRVYYYLINCREIYTRETIDI